jgi:hypothetical protein
MAMDLNALKRIIRAATSARPVEIGCDDCLEQIDVFAEHKLANKDVPQAIRLVEEHLARCDDCSEEFESLLAVLRRMETYHV